MLHRPLSETDRFPKSLTTDVLFNGLEEQRVQSKNSLTLPYGDYGDDTQFVLVYRFKVFL